DLGAWLKGLKGTDDPFALNGLRNALGPAAADLLAPAVTGADGTFRLRGIGRERVAVLRFEAPAIETRDVHAMTRRGPAVRVPSQTAGPLVFHGASFDHAAAPTRPVVGVVRDRDTGKPLAGVTVRSAIASAWSSSGRRDLRATTDREGRYRLAGLPRGGGQRLLLEPPAGLPYPAATGGPPAGTGLAPVQVDFALKRGVVIRGRVTDGVTGKPVRATVEYYAFADNPHLREAPDFRASGRVSAATGPDGSFALVGLPGRG